jgi:hypothetical protein
MHVSLVENFCIFHGMEAPFIGRGVGYIEEVLSEVDGQEHESGATKVFKDKKSTLS